MVEKLGVLTSGLLVVAAALFGQNNVVAPPSTPAGSQVPVAVEGPSARNDGATLPKAVDVKSYEIGPNDVLRIEVWQSQDYTRPSVLVRPDGRITMPPIGELQVEGLTPDRLQKQLAQALKEFINDPDVTVSVLQVNSKSFRVVGTGVGRPGNYALTTPIHIYEAIQDAGGFRDYAKKDKVIIMRGPTMRLEFNAKDYEKGKVVDDKFDPSKVNAKGVAKVGNILVLPSDIIRVDD
jgi:polysaccharide export outer membrane protein